MSMPYRPEPTPPKTTSPSMMLVKRHHAAERSEAVVHSVDCAATGIGRDGGKQRAFGDAVAHFLALHVAARTRPRCGFALRRESADAAATLPNSTTVNPAAKSTNIAANTAQPWPGEPVIRPSV